MYGNWMELAATGFAEGDVRRTVAVLPTAAIEQHGPHLPVGTDSLIAAGMLSEVALSPPSEAALCVLPVQTVGKSNEHVWARGTITLSAETAMRAWTEIGESVVRSGIRKLIIVNSHGGNLDLVSIVARELRVRCGMLAVKCQWNSFGHPEGMYSAHERQYGIHGGDVETSLMLHFRPELVDMSKARDFRSTAETDPVPPTGAISYGWSACDLNPQGVVGNAAAASAAKGRATARHQARGFAALADKVSGMQLDRFSPTDAPERFPG